MLGEGSLLWERFEAKIREIQPDLVGITSTTPAFGNVIKITEIIKRISPETFIVMGGPNASVIPELALEVAPSIDVVCVGEGEETILELAEFIQDRTNPLKSIKGIAYREDGRIVSTALRPRIENLDDLPFPARHLLGPLNRYYFVGHCYQRLPVTSMITSRGCSHHCDFCTQGVFGYRYRAQRPERVVSEMEHLVKDYKIKSIMTVDDTFTADRDRLIGICDLILRKKLKVAWLCYAGIQEMDKEMLVMMKKAGCFQLYYGIESGSQRILDRMNKEITLEQIRRVVKETRDAGLEVRGQFMFGYPSETREDIEDTIALSCELNIDYAEFGVTVPLPGTKLYEWAKSRGSFALQKRSDFQKFQEGTSLFLRPIVGLGEVNEDELADLMKKAYRGFYLRPGYILKRLVKLRTPNDVKKNMQAFFSVAFEMIKFFRIRR